MKKILFLMILASFSFSAAKAQVTIGNKNISQKVAVLELISNNNKGLRLA